MFAKAREKQKLAANGAPSLPNNDKATNGVGSAGEAASKSGGEKNEHMADAEEEKEEEEESASEGGEEEKSEASSKAQAKRQKLDEPKKQKKATKEKKDKKEKKDNEDKKDKKERKPMSISAYRVFCKVRVARGHPFTVQGDFINATYRKKMQSAVVIFHLLSGLRSCPPTGRRCHKKLKTSTPYVALLTNTHITWSFLMPEVGDGQQTQLREGTDAGQGEEDLQEGQSLSLVCCSA